MMIRWKMTLPFLLVVLILSSCASDNDQVLTTPEQISEVILPVPSLTAALPPITLQVTSTSTAPVVTAEPSFTPAFPPIQTTIPTELSPTSLSDLIPLSPPYEYQGLEELTVDIELRYVAWETEGSTLVYALVRPEARSAEPKDWAWWRYDLETSEKISLSPPVSRVAPEIRQQLDLCPTQQVPLVARPEPECPGPSKLLESPTSERIVFSPLSSYGSDTWLGNIDGTNLIKLETPIESADHVQWSSDARWLLLSVHFPGMPGQFTHYLVSADGSFEMQFSILTSHDTFLLNGLFPQFSPDGTKLAYVGSTVFDSFDRSTYHLYVLNLENMESQLVSDRIGMFQWSADGYGLYVLDGGFYPVDPYADTSGKRMTTLYYLNGTTQLGKETIIAQNIPYYPPNSSGTWLWSYLPEVHALAYVGYGGASEFGVLLLMPRPG